MVGTPLKIDISCPVCGSLCSDPPLYNYSTAEAAAHFCPATRNAERYQRLTKAIDKLWQGSDCCILRCQECGFAFGHPFIGGDEEFYSILHEQKGYPSWRWDYEVAIEQVITKFSGGRILEIGAGVGIFLKSLKPIWRRFAVEASELNRQDLEQAGIEVFRDLPEAAQRDAGTFQVIVLFQVLEHISEFETVLAQCHQLLCPGGYIVITVPDGEAMIQQERLTGCPDMPPNHINKWTPESLSRALRAAGFETQPAICEPGSWRNLKNSLYLKVLSDAARPNTLAAQVYRIQNKRIRTPFLSLLGIPALLHLFPSLAQLKQGGAFAMIGIVHSR